MTRAFHYLRFAFLIIAIATNAAAQTPPFNRTVIVPATGDVTADGAALISALANLSPAPNYGARWLIKLEPGIYDVGTTSVIMREYVDIEGSGILETMIRGTVAPPPGSLIGGLVEGASKSEIRSLTISCNSNMINIACQGMSLNGANPRLTQLRILVQGTGTGGHWGIRTFNSAPILDDVEIKVSASSSFDNYGIVYGGNSTMNIQRSSIVARDASGHNWGIVLKENLGWSPIRDSKVTAIGGTWAGGVMFLASFTNQSLMFDNVEVTAHGGTTSTGIGSAVGEGTPKIWFRGGRIYGATEGVNLFSSTIYLSNSEVYGPTILVVANKVWIGSTWLKGGGIILGITAAKCAGVFDDAFTFFPNKCPGVTN
jgi:hypothetical protein